tara:strand:- start:3376 stop:3534 length:159 start_codon:yes stop_codon:yes gene_type:complete
LIKEAVKAVIGVGKHGGQFQPSPMRIILFAFLVASLFLGTIALLLTFASIVT